MINNKDQIRVFYDNIASQRVTWRGKNRYYYKQLEKYYSFYIPTNSKVLEIGCGTGELINAVKPKVGVGIDFSPNMIEIAQKTYPNFSFYVQDAEDLRLEEKFEYIIMSDLMGSLWDVQKAIKELNKVSDNKTRIIISFYNYMWEPILNIAEYFHLKMKPPVKNWLSSFDIKYLLELEGFEIVHIERKVLLPKYIPFVSSFLNKIVSNFYLINKLCLVNFIIARKILEIKTECPVSIIIPAKNEKGNIENAILRMPIFGSSQEIIFVEGDSSDGTYEEMLKIKDNFKDSNILVIKQSGKGKSNAVREGFDKATGEVLMILDADLAVSPEDLPKFYEALKSNRGEFINGCRLVYQLHDQSMRFLNLLANKFFASVFTFLLGQRLKDTLCGTKVLSKSDYDKIKRNRDYFGDFDPFGDFDLLFGASKLNLKIVEVPVRYHRREYGETQIRRFSHGWLLLKMSVLAAKKIKFI